MDQPSDHLLRTFASVPVRSRVLDLGCGHGVHTAPLLSLGFDVYTCDVEAAAVAHTKEAAGTAKDVDDLSRRIVQVDRLANLSHPEGFFDWVIVSDLSRSASTPEEIVQVLREARRVLAPGGWVYVAADAVPADFNPNDDADGYASDSGLHFTFSADSLNALFKEANLAVAEAPRYVDAHPPRLEAVYRRVEPGTTL